ncbi:TetR/AcrR family transcriptional regulator C-terminal domain-containing protein [Pseudonocardia sp. DSM 110487]|uniref:TetR/AcrR family transcriptional regulator C-terminal domain-containing protein n=1 Tax=Pseudonocardia sp. DSM 110487 TaxID=2865833 RepID=UPI001C694AE3|nr:TetR/AcrR family transcriptional regulator C-terminal domain-containing protein [Pseudonocardia sp. DSM 110487]QYN36673.1 TetR/AcrR family transcriptional regulator C-terminal domain-containing protein [Pseudonocardia sp. DSM 110487]
MTETTSARIAGDLRARIAAGEFGPGDRVPSTRELTRQWGVAMATATRALSLLQDEGVLRSVRGVGTVVAARPTERPGRRRTTRSPARDEVVRAAIAVADAEGLPTLSMRRIAAELGIPTMTLYQHVAGKDELVTLMIDRAFGEEPLPGRPPADWRTALETAARVEWAAFRRHPWLAPAMSLTRPQLVPSALAYTEWVLEALDGRGLDTAAAFTVHIMLFNHVRGMAVNLESEAQAEAESGLTADEWMDTNADTLTALAAGENFPHFKRIASIDFDLDLDALFELGLRCLLDGLRGVLP